MTERLFDETTRQYRPLLHRLQEWAYVPETNVDNLRKRDFDSWTDDELLNQNLAEWTAQTEKLRRIDPVIPSEEPVTQWRRNEDDEWTNTAVRRWATQFILHGNTELLRFWPESFADESCSSDLYSMPIPDQVWLASPSGARLVVDVVADDSPPSLPTERIEAGAAYLDRFIEAVNRDIAGFDVALRERLAERLARRRATLGAIADQRVRLIELLRVEPRHLTFADDLGHKPVVGEVPTAVGDGGVPISVGRVVYEQTFFDLIEVTKKWGAAVARYPMAFSLLEEEFLSSLLVPTLNVAFDVALREVFLVGGKSDIYVGSVRPGREEAAFFGEAKIWDGEASVKEALSQVQKYSNAATTRAMLLFYVKRQKFDLAKQRCRQALAACGDFLSWEPDEVDVAVIRHPRYDTRMKVTLVFIHIPEGDMAPRDPDDDNGGAE